MRLSLNNFLTEKTTLSYGKIIMNNQLQEIRDQQKKSWNKFAAGWKKWDPVTKDFLRPMGDAIINYIDPKDGQKILDIAAGTGEPALSIAAKFNNAIVTITDLAEEMLEAAREKALQNNIHNIETIVCDVCNMPFKNEMYDAVSCRFGFMFFADMQIAANEMARVVKPGGRIAATVWNFPEKNFWASAIMETIMRWLNIPPPPPEVPGIFRCCKPGRMRSIFENAGLKNIEEREVVSALNAGSVEKYWEMMTEMGASVAGALNQGDENMQQKIKDDVFRLIKEKYPEKVSLPASAILITAIK